MARAVLKAVGSDPDEFPPGFLEIAVPLGPVFRRGRPFSEADLPLDELAAASFPKLVVSDGHHAGFDAMCRDLARRIGGAHAVVEGAGHEIQFTGAPLNERLLDLWRSAAAATTDAERWRPGALAGPGWPAKPPRALRTAAVRRRRPGRPR